jgi:tetratricopeptide (TPR) repeat protein
MRRLICATLGMWLCFTVPGWTQGSIRNVTINAETDEGKLLQQAGEESDPVKRVALLEQFLAQYGSHESAGYVHYQLLNEYLKVNNFEKAAEHGQKTLAVVPNDLEVAHLTVKALEGRNDPEALIALVEKTNETATKAAAAPQPADADEVEAWKRSTEFAAQVKQYNEHALYATAVKQASPQTKIQLLDALRKNYAGGQFEKSLDALYFQAYQQMGENEKMLQAAEAALEHDPNNETYLYLVAENNSDPAKNKLGEALSQAQRIVDTLPNKPKPENLTEEDWSKHKDLYTGLARSIIGRSLAAQNKCAPAVKELQAAATGLKGNEPVLAPVYYFLGFCSARLERHRDALTYFGLAAKISGPYQAPSNDMLKKIRAALGGR